MLPAIIDAHAHPFLSKRDNTSFLYYGTGPKSPDDFVAQLRRAGITRACGSVIRPLDGVDFNEIRGLNDDAVEMARMFPDFFIPGMHINPSFPEESCREIERMRAQGVRFVGELVSYMMGHDGYAMRAAFPVYDLMQQLGMVLNIHPADESDTDILLRQFPRLQVILAHPGEKREYLLHLDRMMRFDNAHLDLSGTGLFRNGMLRYGIDRIGRDRFIFGTDYPICNPAMQVHGVMYEELTDDEREAVFSKNFLRLMGEG